MAFPQDFVWGVATSSYQIEGAAFEDGKGESIWDQYCRREGVVFRGHTGEIACDHYHRYREDVKMMADLGIKAYRFSISWPRILPQGTGEINLRGLEFYSNLVTELLRYGIEPYVTLFHWDYPLELQHQGGWLNRDSPKWFEEYVRIVVRSLKGRVKHFITFNEPQVFIGDAYIKGNHPPAWKLPDEDVVRISHHVMLAHGLAVKAIREECPEAKVGYAPTMTVRCPATDKSEDIQAAYRANFSLSDFSDNWCWSTAWWSDPVVLGSYPEEGLKRFEKDLPAGFENDLKTICQPLDFYCQNIYTGTPVCADGCGGWRHLEKTIGYSKNAMGWAVEPQSLYWGPKFLSERYQLPIVITENGMSCHDTVSLDGKVHDPNRIDYLNRYLLQLKRANDTGANIIGYFQWSLMDNFEWGRGYDDRFGLVYIDYKTQERIPKDSAGWYKKVICSNGDSL